MLRPTSSVSIHGRSTLMSAAIVRVEPLRPFQSMIHLPSHTHTLSLSLSLGPCRRHEAYPRDHARLSAEAHAQTRDRRERSLSGKVEECHHSRGPSVWDAADLPSRKKKRSRYPITCIDLAGRPPSTALVRAFSQRGYRTSLIAQTYTTVTASTTTTSEVGR